MIKCREIKKQLFLAYMPSGKYIPYCASNILHPRRLQCLLGMTVHFDSIARHILDGFSTTVNCLASPSCSHDSTSTKHLNIYQRFSKLSIQAFATSLNMSHVCKHLVDGTVSVQTQQIEKRSCVCQVLTQHW